VRNNIFVPSGGARKGSPGLLIVFTDGKSQEAPSVVAVAARALRDQGVGIFALGIPGDVDVAQLRQIAGATGHVFVKQTFEQLGPAAIKELGLQGICSNAKTTTGGETSCKLGNCLECNIAVNGSEICTLCSKGRFLAGGKCKKTLICRGYKVAH